MKEIPKNVSQSTRARNPHLYQGVASSPVQQISMRPNKIDFTCGKCGIVFQSQPSTERKYCSLKCAYESKDRVAHRVPKDRGAAKCENCQKTFQIKTGGGKRFCSRKCVGEKISVVQMAKNRQVQDVETESLICAVCSEKFDAPKCKHRKCCSVRCGIVLRASESSKTKRANGDYDSHNCYSRSKYGWRIIGGKKYFYRSSWEANYARYLEFQKKNGLIDDWEHEPQTFWFEAIKRGVCSYLPDFRVFIKDRTEYHEVKGWMDARSKTKIKRMAKYYPSVILVVIDANRYRAISKSVSKIIPGWETRTRNGPKSPSNQPTPIKINYQPKE